ncbi:MAG: hypothetical protein EB039_13850, partial [Proteobacteria bacterium]|nr:hypothetical protein [Pseudomonadota bacterium]
ASATISTASWYLRNEVGANLIPSISLKDKSVDLGFGTATATGGKLSMDAGVAWNVAVSFGWIWRAAPATPDHKA